MNRLAKLQLIGPLVLAVMIVAAELAACLLAVRPSSEIAWYLNLEIFGIFQRSHYVLSDRFDIAFFQLMFVGIPLLLLCAISFVSRRRFLVAMTSHFGFIYACFVAYAVYLTRLPALQAASLEGSQYSSVMNLSALYLSIGPQVLIMMALLVTSSLSLAGSHIHYLRAVRQS